MSKKHETPKALLLKREIIQKDGSTKLVSLIPPRYISGWLNTDTGEFNKNPNQNLVLSEEDKEKLIQRINELSN